MLNRKRIQVTLNVACAALILGSVAAAAEPAPASAAPGADDLAKMMELAKPGANHQVLAGLVGTWAYKMKFWMVPGAPPLESSGTATRKPILDGHYFMMDSAAKMQMPGADGKMTNVDFKGMSIEGYDNVKQKFVSTWIDNMGTSIIMSEGTYDPATKTLTYDFEEEAAPGMKSKVRQTITILDKDHHVYDWYEMRGDAEVKTMELSCTRQP